MRTMVPLRLAFVGLVAIGGLAASGARADNHHIRIEQLLAGANGDSSVQFLELKFQSPGQNDWGPQPIDPNFPESRSRLVFYDATGAQTGEFEFPHDPAVGPSDPDNGGHSVLVATQAFVDRAGIAADFVMEPLIVPLDGMVCYRHNPSNFLGFTAAYCLAYGSYAGGEELDPCGNPNGAPAPALPIAGAEPQGLDRIQHTGVFEQFECTPLGPINADFALRPVAARNSAGETAALFPEDLAHQGANLFNLETFGGNGRTCESCHTAADGLGLAPATIAARFADDPGDPLFVAENDPALASLENSCLMRGGNERGLILENIDGFGNDPVFRNSTHLINAALTAPYGWSGGFADLRAFASGAVKQHFPRTLARNDDPSAGPLDFRLPTPFELEALEAFMRSAPFPADGNRDIERLVVTAVAEGADEMAVRRGQALFFGDMGEAQCFRCHSGPALAEADGSLGTGTGNLDFDTGVTDLLANLDDGCAGGPGDPTAPLPAEAGGAREFNTPGLLGVSTTAPYFHDNSAPTLRDAVAFYDSGQFQLSPAGTRMADLGLAVSLRAEDIDDLTAFLEALSVEPGPGPPPCSDGLDNDGDGLFDVAADSGCLSAGDGSEVLGDLDFDRDVDQADHTRLLAAFGLTSGDAGFLDAGDFDRDGAITFVDLQGWDQAHADFHAPPPAPACGLLGIEPLLVLALARALARRGRRRERTAPRVAAAVLAAGFGAAEPASALVVLHIGIDGPQAMGSTFEVDVFADLTEPVLGFGLDVHYDDTVVTMMGAPEIGPAWMPLFAPDGDGLAGAARPDAVSGIDVLLATLVFSAESRGNADFSLGFTTDDLTEGFPLVGSGFDTVLYNPKRVVVTPEPSAALLLALGLAALGIRGRARRGVPGAAGRGLALSLVLLLAPDPAAADPNCRAGIKVIDNQSLVEDPTSNEPCPEHKTLFLAAGAVGGDAASEVGSVATSGSVQTGAGIDFKNTTIDAEVTEISLLVSGPGSTVTARLVLDFEFDLSTTRADACLSVQLQTASVAVFTSQVNGQSALNGTLDYEKGFDAACNLTQDLFGPMGFLGSYACPLGAPEDDTVACSAVDTVVSSDLTVPVGTAFAVRIATESYAAATNGLASGWAFTRLTLGDGVLELPPGYTLTLAVGSPIPDYEPVAIPLPAGMADPSSLPVLSPWGLGMLVGLLAGSSVRALSRRQRR